PGDGRLRPERLAQGATGLLRGRFEVRGGRGAGEPRTGGSGSGRGRGEGDPRARDRSGEGQPPPRVSRTGAEAADQRARERQGEECGSMAQEFRLPKLGESDARGVVVRVLASPGDAVEVDQPVLEVETDKAVAEVPSTLRGTVREVHVKEGDEVG